MEFTMLERRITLRLLAYWEKLRGNRLMPHEQDLKPEDISDLWDNCFLIRIKSEHHAEDHYAHLGQAIVDAYHYGLGGGDRSNILSPNPAKLNKNYETVIATGKPLLEDGEFKNPQNHIVRYRQCLLPLGQGTEVKAIFGGMRFKIFSAPVVN